MPTQRERTFSPPDAHYRSLVAHSTEGFWCVEFAPGLPLSTSAPNLVEVIARNGYAIEVNDAAASVLGRRRGSELLGAGLRTLLPLELGPLRELVGHFLANNLRLSDSEVTVVCDDGEHRFLLTLTGVVQERCLTHIWGQHRAQPERVRFREQLHRMHKLASVGRVARSVAHDFNNQLTAILGFAEMVEDELGDEHASAPDIAQVLKAGRRAEALVRQLLAFSRRQSTREDLLDLNAVLRDFEPLIRRVVSEEIEIQLNLCDDLPLVRADRGHLELLVMNLALNAREAMPRTGQLTIETSAPGGDESGEADHREVRLRMSDTGCGMRPEVRARIFEPFFSTKPDAVGLGLSTVQEIVSAVGGHLAVESQPDCGTTIECCFPAAAAVSADLVVADVVARVLPYAGGTRGASTATRA